MPVNHKSSHYISKEVYEELKLSLMQGHHFIQQQHPCVREEKEEERVRSENRL